MSHIKGLVFEGGGVLGTAHIGALTIASKHINLEKVTYFAGASAGSIVAGLCACRLPVNDMVDAVNSINFKDLMDDDLGIVRDVERLWKKFGYHKGDALENMFGDILSKYIGNKHITLKEVHEKYNSYLIIPVTEMFKHTCKTVYFTPDSYPDVELKTVVRYSSSYPFMFTAKSYYSDGGILDNYPIKKLSEYIQLDQIIGFNFKSDKSEKQTIERPANVIEFGTSILSGLRKKANNLTDKELSRTILIRTGTYKSMNLTITDEDKKALFNYGVSSASEFFNSNTKKSTK